MLAPAPLRRLALVAAFGACAPASPQPAGPSTVPVAPSADAASAASASASTSASSAVVPPIVEVELAGPAEPGCSIERDAWHGDLSLEPDGKPFARALGIGSTIELASKGNGVFARSAGEGLRVAAWASGVSIYPARAVTLSGIVVPMHSVALDWKGAERSGAVVVSIDTSSALSDPPSVSGDVACGDLSLDPKVFDARRGQPKATQPDMKPFLNAGAPLSDTPGGAPVAHAKEQLVDVVGRRKGTAHIVIEEPSYVISGWVPSSSVSAESGIGPSFFGPQVGGEYTAQITIAPSHNFGCSVDLPLFVEAFGKRANIGTITARTPFSRTRDQTGEAFVEIEPYGRQWLALTDGARLLVRRSDLSGC